MSDSSQDDVSFEQVNERLKEITEAVSDENLPLDEALELFDEAVALGMRASEIMEDDIAARDAQAQQREDEQAAADAAADAEFEGESVESDKEDAQPGIQQDAEEAREPVQDTPSAPVEFDSDVDLD